MQTSADDAGCASDEREPVGEAREVDRQQAGEEIETGNGGQILDAARHGHGGGEAARQGHRDGQAWYFQRICGQCEFLLNLADLQLRAVPGERELVDPKAGLTERRIIERHLLESKLAGRAAYWSIRRIGDA